MYVPLDNIRVSAKQREKVSFDKVKRHIEALNRGNDLVPIDVHRLDDGTFVIDGNGRHRYFAYLEAGIPLVPVNVKQSKNFRPTGDYL